MNNGLTGCTKTLHWCKQQKKGIVFVSPNERLSNKYHLSSFETLQELSILSSQMWKITLLYYSGYFIVNSFLIKLGIQSEIHECTIALSEYFENKEIFPKGFTSCLKLLKKKRIDSQYYLQHVESIPFDEMNMFINEISKIVQELSYNDCILLCAKLKDEQ